MKYVKYNMKKSELKQIIKEEIDKVLKENQNTNEEFDARFNNFSSIFLETYYDMNDHKITFDAATEKLFAWIKENFK
jgi:hypothetical protein